MKNRLSLSSLPPRRGEDRACPEPAEGMRMKPYLMGFALIVALLVVGCGQGTYPLDIFYEMHYQQTFKSHEPPRMAGVVGAVPVDWVPVPKSTSFNTGEHLFNVNCSMCHGSDGKGRGVVLEMMRDSYGYKPIIDPPDLTDNPPGSIVGILQATSRPFGPDSVMPPFAKLLTPAERLAIAEFIGAPSGSTTEEVVKPPKPPETPGKLEISVNGDDLQFDKNLLPEVSAGSQVVLVFANVSGINQHNWVLVKAGTKDAVAQRGVVAGLQSGWLQSGDADVLANTNLLDPGATVELKFDAPAAGTYQFVCTFPGHAATMFGDFVVTP